MMLGFANVAAYGEDLKNTVMITERLEKDAKDEKWVNYFVLILYSVSTVIAYPLKLYPTITITEGYVFSAAMKDGFKKLWL